MMMMMMMKIIIAMMIIRMKILVTTTTISRSTTYSFPDDSFERCRELSRGCVALSSEAASHDII